MRIVNEIFNHAGLRCRVRSTDLDNQSRPFEWIAQIEIETYGFARSSTIHIEGHAGNVREVLRRVIQMIDMEEQTIQEGATNNKNYPKAEA